MLMKMKSYREMQRKQRILMMELDLLGIEYPYDRDESLSFRTKVRCLINRPLAEKIFQEEAEKYDYLLSLIRSREEHKKGIRSSINFLRQDFEKKLHYKMESLG